MDEKIIDPRKVDHISFDSSILFKLENRLECYAIRTLKWDGERKVYILPDQPIYTIEENNLFIIKDWLQDIGY